MTLTLRQLPELASRLIAAHDPPRENEYELKRLQRRTRDATRAKNTSAHDLKLGDSARTYLRLIHLVRFWQRESAKPRQNQESESVKPGSNVSQNPEQHDELRARIDEKNVLQPTSERRAAGTTRGGGGCGDNVDVAICGMRYLDGVDNVFDEENAANLAQRRVRVLDHEIGHLMDALVAGRDIAVQVVPARR